MAAESTADRIRLKAIPAIVLALLSLGPVLLEVAPLPPLAAAAGPRADATPPPPIAGLAAVDAHDGKVNLSWAPSTAVDFAYYAIYASNVSFLTLGNRTPLARLDNITDQSYTVANLTDGVPYFFAVTAADLSGNEDRTVVSVSATPTSSVVPDTTPPPAVTGLAAVDARDGKVNLTWAPVNVPDLARYTIYMSNRTGTTVSELAPALSISNTSAGRATITGLIDNTTYYFAVTAVDLSGNEDRTVLANIAATPTPTPPATTPAPTTAVRPAKADLEAYYAVIIVALAAVATYLAIDRAEGAWGTGAARKGPGDDGAKGDDDEEE